MGLVKIAAKAAVASSVHGRVQRRQQQRWAEQDQRTTMSSHAALPPPPPPPPAPAVEASSQIELLERLGALRQSGVLTDEEFEAKKAEILRG